ncbi:MAG: hypothetical protein LQ347_002194 [Umbilicaria vellea]|nr:MAG: hypothetical protein LQ347_002194 [Umbilicaria vellea]
MSHRDHDDHTGHSHNHHDHSHGHDHSDDIEPALQSLIYQPIEFSGIRTLNETESNSGAKVIQKTWAQRLDAQPRVTSDSDEQLLIFVPLAGAVKLHSILIRSSTDNSAPQTLKLFTNKDDLDFGSALEQTPTQTLTLSQTSDVQDVPVKRTLFNNVYSLTLFFEDNYGDDATRVYYLGFKGEFMRLNREPVEFLYEKAANPRDHKLVQGVGSLGAQGSGHGL